jgi:hypothetical protein
MTPAESIREIGWIAREARALVDERVSPTSERWAAYLERKRALLEYVAAKEARQ